MGEVSDAEVDSTDEDEGADIVFIAIDRDMANLQCELRNSRFPIPISRLEKGEQG